MFYGLLILIINSNCMCNEGIKIKYYNIVQLFLFVSIVKYNI